MKHVSARYITVCFFFILTLSAFGQLRFEHDLNERKESSDIRNLTVFDNRIFFSANDGYHGQELWVHEPANNLTYLLLDAREGSPYSHPENFLVFDDRLFFSAGVGQNSSSSIFTLGIGQSTPEVVPGPRIPDLNDIVFFKGQFYTANDYALIRRSLDDASGQRIHPNFSSSPKAYVNVIDQDEDYLYFTSIDESNRTRQLFKFDGLDVEQLTTVNDYPTDLIIEQGVLVQEHLAFEVKDNPHLVLYDLRAGQLRIDSTVEFQRSPANTSLANTILAFEDELYLQYEKAAELPDIKRYSFARGALDPTFSVNPRASARWVLQEANGNLYGWYSSGGIYSGGREFYQIDPEGNHTRLDQLSYLLENRQTSVYSESALAILNDKLYAYGSLDRQNFELLSYDFTSEEINQVFEIHRGTETGIIAYMTSFDESRIALSSRFIGPASASGYVSLEAKVKTYNPALQLIEDIVLPNDLEQLSTSQFHRQGDRLFLQNIKQNDSISYRTIALNTRTGTVEVIDTVGGQSDSYSSFGPFIEWDNKIYFPDRDEFGGGNHLQVYDPSTQTTLAALPMDSVSIPSSAYVNSCMAVYNDTLYFLDAGTDRFTYDYALRSLDTEGNLSEISLDSFDHFSSARLAVFSDRFIGDVEVENRRYSVYFKPESGIKLITYRGEPLEDILLISKDLETDSLIYFVANRSVYSMEKATDEVALVADFEVADPDLPLSSIELLSILDGYILFSARLNSSGAQTSLGQELYQYNLEDRTISLAADIYEGTGSSRPRAPHVFEGRVYFSAESAFGGRELWSYKPGCFKVNLRVQPDSIQSAPNGSATPVIINGTPPYRYEWTTGDTTQRITELEAGYVRVRVTDATGCSGSAFSWIETALPENVVDIQELNSLSAKLFPNPTSGKVTLEFEKGLAQDATARLYSGSGHLITTVSIVDPNSFQVSLDGYPQGFYYLQLSNEGHQVVYRVVKM